LYQLNIMWDVQVTFQVVNRLTVQRDYFVHKDIQLHRVPVHLFAFVDQHVHRRHKINIKKYTMTLIEKQTIDTTMTQIGTLIITANS